MTDLARRLAAFDPRSLACDAFVAGPDRWEEWDGSGSLLDVDPIFGKDFARILREAREHDPASVEPAPDAVRTPCESAPGHVFVDVPDGLLLLSPEGEPVGGYVGTDLGLVEALRGRGIGAEIVLERAMRDGGLPTWELDEAAYTPAGAAAHHAAWRLAGDRSLFMRKSARLAAATLRAEGASPQDAGLPGPEISDDAVEAMFAALGPEEACSRLAEGLPRPAPTP